MTVLHADDFNRADSPTVDALKYTGSSIGDFSVAGNRLHAVSSSTFIVTTANAHAAFVDGKVSITILNNTTLDAGPMIRATSDGSQGYFADYLAATSIMNVWRRIANSDTQVGPDLTSFSLTIGDKFTIEASGTGTTVTLKVYVNDVIVWTFGDTDAARLTAAGFAGLAHFLPNGVDYDNLLVEDLTPVLSSPTPSGTIPSATTATIGATTSGNTGTLYVVVDTAANLSGVTATQIKSGQKASGAAALASGNISVASATPSVNISGLSGASALAYAIVQNNGADSNVVTGTFNTAGLLEQEGFIFRNDDGSESTATSKAAQDTNITSASDLNTRLRVLINGTGDPYAQKFKIKYRKVGTTDWREL